MGPAETTFAAVIVGAFGLMLKQMLDDRKEMRTQRTREYRAFDRMASALERSNIVIERNSTAFESLVKTQLVSQSQDKPNSRRS